ncbi:hypothetical protein F4779DRAFT_562164, partial [Xylariaceae sp. FL0662B]
FFWRPVLSAAVTLVMVTGNSGGSGTAQTHGVVAMQTPGRCLTASSGGPKVSNKVSWALRDVGSSSSPSLALKIFQSSLQSTQRKQARPAATLDLPAARQENRMAASSGSGYRDDIR